MLASPFLLVGGLLALVLLASSRARWPAFARLAPVLQALVVTVSLAAVALLVAALA